MGSLAPKGSLARSDELSKSHLISPDASLPDLLTFAVVKNNNNNLKKKKNDLLGSLRRGRKFLPPRGEEPAAARREVAGRRSRPPPPGRLRRCPLDGRREGRSRPKYLTELSAPTAAAAAVATARVCQGAELPPSAATERPRRVQGEGRRAGRPRPAAPPPPRRGRFSEPRRLLAG